MRFCPKMYSRNLWKTSLFYSRSNFGSGVAITGGPLFQYNADGDPILLGLMLPSTFRNSVQFRQMRFLRMSIFAFAFTNVDSVNTDEVAVQAAAPDGLRRSATPRMTTTPTPRATHQPPFRRSSNTPWITATIILIMATAIASAAGCLCFHREKQKREKAGVEQEKLIASIIQNSEAAARRSTTTRPATTFDPERYRTSSPSRVGPSPAGTARPGIVTNAFDDGDEITPVYKIWIFELGKLLQNFWWK